MEDGKSQHYFHSDLPSNVKDFSSSTMDPGKSNQKE